MRRLVGLAVVGLATLAPTWANADDEQIAQEIIQKLQGKKNAGLLKGFGIDLEVDNGTVWMKGIVSSSEQQKMALDIARRVPGVEKVVNELALKPAEAPAPEPAPKPMIMEDEPTSVPEFTPISTKNISAMETSSPAKSLSPVNSPIQAMPQREMRPRLSGKTGFLAGISKGIANAMGPHDSPEPKRAQPQFRQVAHEETDAGNRTPKATAAPPAPAAPKMSADDEQIVRQIAKVLQFEKQAGKLKGFKIDVNSKEGVVWVSGHVANTEQHTRVIDIARRVSGVKQVVNDLKVQVAERGVGSVNHNDPSTPVPEGTGVVRRPVRPAPYVEAVPVVDPTSSSEAPPQPKKPVAIEASATTVKPNPPAQQAMPMAAPPGMTLVPVPVQLMPAPMGMQPQYRPMPQTPLAFAPSHASGTVPAQNMAPIPGQGQGMPIPAQMPTPGVGIAPARYDHPNMPGYSWPSYAAYPNYAAVTYPKQYSPSAWPYIGPFYPYPQVPLGWRKVQLQWDDGWWYLDFKDK